MDHKKLHHFLEKNEYLFLLIFLSAFLLLPSFFIDPILKNGVIYGLLIAVIIIGIYELSESNHSFWMGLIFGLIALVSNSFSVSENITLIFLIRMGSLVCFFSLLTIHLLIRISKTKTINTNLIYGAINGYILIGLIGGMGFRLINHFYPHSFIFGSGLEPKIDDLTYFSFITLSSLGYGDITPVSSPGQSLSIFISICGQMYTAIVIGIIIGKFILIKKKESQI
ncbi:MAG: ion channel [Saprospiraceae bacterium]